MFHAVIDHTPNSDAVRKGQGGGARKEREGGKKAREAVEGRRKEERKVRGKQGCNTAYTHAHVHAQGEGK